MDSKVARFKFIKNCIFIAGLIGVCFIFLKHLILGISIILFFAGLDSINRFIFKQEPYFLAGIIRGGDYLMKKILKEKFNQYYNLFWGILLLILCAVIVIKKYLFS